MTGTRVTHGAGGAHTQTGLALGRGHFAHGQRVGVDVPSGSLAVQGSFALGQLPLHPLLVVLSALWPGRAVHGHHASLYTPRQPLHLMRKEEQTMDGCTHATHSLKPGQTGAEGATEEFVRSFNPIRLQRVSSGKMR